MYTISNGFITATINPAGAELTNLVRSDIELNYLWNGDPKWWPKHSPVLFPIVGSLKNNSYTYNGKEYHLPRHGFAREKVFDVTFQSDASISFVLKEDESTLSIFPFRFLLLINYTLENNKLTVTYTVTNPGEKEIYFCIGAHPAFAVPLIKGSSYEDYFLEFSLPETLSRYGLTNGLLNNEPETFLVNQKTIQLTPSLFEKDAIVLKNPVSDTLSIKGNTTTHGLSFTIGGWPHLGIWAAANAAPFVCIEPWQGHADTVDHDGELIHKPGIITLDPQKSWSKNWRVELF